MVEETGVTGDKTRPVTDKLDHIMLYGVHLAWSVFEHTYQTIKCHQQTKVKKIKLKLKNNVRN